MRHKGFYSLPMLQRVPLYSSRLPHFIVFSAQPDFSLFSFWSFTPLQISAGKTAFSSKAVFRSSVQIRAAGFFLIWLLFSYTFFLKGQFIFQFFFLVCLLLLFMPFAQLLLWVWVEKRVQLFRKKEIWIVGFGFPV